ncbi:MAG: hypothetical protein GY850_26575 [bacterium]|nr:hypothetical protein [bacterium]
MKKRQSSPSRTFNAFPANANIREPRFKARDLVSPNIPVVAPQGSPGMRKGLNIKLYNEYLRAKHTHCPIGTQNLDPSVAAGLKNGQFERSLKIQKK